MTKRLEKIINEVSRQVSEVSNNYNKEGKYLGEMLDEKISLSIRDVEYLIMRSYDFKEDELILHNVK